MEIHRNFWLEKNRNIKKSWKMSAQQRMRVANEKASKNITQRGNVVKPVSKKMFLKKLAFETTVDFS